jgi:DNA-binding transcriptional ArsR family regulator
VVRRLIEITDPRIARAIAHPLRRELLRRFGEREASPSELAAELDQPVPVVSYHVRKLAQLELIELVRTTPRRGATEHHYRATGETYFPGEALAELPDVVRNALVESWWRQLVTDVGASLAAGGWDRPEAQALRSAIVLDEQGWRELSAAIDALHQRALKLEAESKARLTGSEPAATALMALLLFEQNRSDAPTDPAG